MKSAAVILLIASLALPMVPADLHKDDVLVNALYHTEPFQNVAARVPNTPDDARSKLQQEIARTPNRAELYEALASVEARRGDNASAENNLRLYIEKSKHKSEAYAALQNFYHQHLRFEDQLRAMQEHAAELTPHKQDVTLSRGRYALYRSISRHISKYHLNVDQRAPYLASIDSYPDQLQPYLDYVNFLRGIDRKEALGAAEKIRMRFPDATNTYLMTKASLLPYEEALDLYNRSFDPLWSDDLLRAFDSQLTTAGKKREYLESLKVRLQKDPLDAEAAARLFHAYQLSGNLMEAQNILNDFRLLKEQKVRGKQSFWSAKELLWMAKLNQKLLNYNEAARYYYALYSQLSYKPQKDLTADFALRGLLDVILAAEDRPIQLSAGSLDYYKDIATMDQSPGVLNGILSLLFNSNNPSSEFQAQQYKAIGYFNRAEALRLVRFTAKHFPESRHLSGMYRDALKIYEKYGMDQLLVEAGEEFFRKFKDAPEILEVGIAVTDAYSRLKNHEREWQTYNFLLPIAAQRAGGNPLFGSEAPAAREEDEYSEEPDRSNSTEIHYELLLSRYIASLTAERNFLEVVRLYKNEIVAHPDEEQLYEHFAAYLTQNQLFDEEKQLYQQAIDRFQGKGWYEKLARWYLRNQRDDEYKQLSQKIMDIFKGTEIESYLNNTLSGLRPLNYALNLYAHEKFPLNLSFVKNLLGHYTDARQWTEWEALSAEYYALDATIRENYLARLSATNRLPAGTPGPDSIDQRFAGDIQIWRSHFEEGAEQYKALAKSDPSDLEINLKLADILRSLGTQNIDNYLASAAIRAKLASLNPSDSSIWTSAGETLADIERYDESQKYWNEILKIDPYSQERYIEVATIYWDYYLFDDALNAINRIRALEKFDAPFAYEAGAIYESKRDYPTAIKEYSKSLTGVSNLAWSRLSELYKRMKYRESIRKGIEAQIQSNGQDPRIWTGAIVFYAEQKEPEMVRSLIARAAETLPVEVFEQVSSTLKQTTRNLGFGDLQVKLIQRETKDAKSDLERWNSMLELARYYEGAKKPAEAETVYRDLYQQQPRSAGVIQELVAYYWRSEQFNKAFDIYKAALNSANANWRKKYLLEVARRYRERKEYTPALQASRELLAIDPINGEYFQLTAEILADQKDFAGLNEHYKQGLKTIGESNLSFDEKKQRTATLRHGIIQANIILKDYTAALDQYIEIINRDAESEEVLRQAADFASRYGLLQRMFDYYGKTAAASPKDHRWPMVLGRLHLFSGDFESAIAQFQSAISLRPERTDFYQQVAESYQRLGKYPEAIAQYQKAYEISFKNDAWLSPMAELHARLGNRKEALRLYGETLKTLTPMRKNFALCARSLEWGYIAEAVAFGKAGFDQYSKDRNVPFPIDGLQHYSEALIRSGNRVEAFQFLVMTSTRNATDLSRATFDTETLRSGQYMIDHFFGTVYVDLLRRYYTSSDYEALETAIFEQTAKHGLRDRLSTNLLAMVRNAQMAPAEERLLRNLVTFYGQRSRPLNGEDWNRYNQYHSQLLAFYKNRHEYKRGAEWMELEFGKLPRSADYREQLIEIANLYRLAEQTDNELRILRSYYLYGNKYELQPQAVERYLDLLYEKSLTEEIKKAAATANLTTINYFFKNQEKGMAVLAIESFCKRQNLQPAWQTTQFAMLGRELRDPSDFFDANFRIALDVRTIGETMHGGRDISKTLEGDDWFYYGRKYGEYLFWIANPSNAFYLPSDLEGQPTSGTRQDELGNFYMQQKQYGKALEHFDFALQLDADHMRYSDGKARALMGLEKRQDAIEVWKELISSANDRDRAAAWTLALQAANEFNSLVELKSGVEPYIAKRIADSGDFNLAALYLKSLSPEERAALVAKWIPTAPAPMHFGQSLLRLNLGTNADATIYKKVNEYLELRLVTAAGSEQNTMKSDYWRWNQRFIKSLLGAKQFDAAVEEINRVVERFEAPEDANTKNDLILLKAKALAQAGRSSEALETLKAYLQPSGSSAEEDVYERQERYRKALQSVQGAQEIEIALKEEMYTWLISSGQTSDANYIGLAEVKLQKQESAEAKALLHKMIYLSKENLQGFAQAAELYEKFERWQEALELREELARRKPWDSENRANHASDLLHLKRNTDAAALAKTLLTDQSAGAKARVLAAQVYGKATTLEVGPAELVAIQRAVRTSGGQSGVGTLYARFLRETLLKLKDPPDSKLVHAQLFLSPEDSILKVRFFRALARDNKCEQAMEVIDRDQQRFSTYSPDDPYETYDDYDDYRRYPIESLNVPENEIADLAMTAARCAEVMNETEGQIFFLQMAQSHSALSEKETTAKQIDALRKKLIQAQQEEESRYHVGLNLGRANQ